MGRADETGKLSREAQRARDNRFKQLKELEQQRLEPLRSAARARIKRKAEDNARAEAVRRKVKMEQRRLRKRQAEVGGSKANHAGTPETRYNHMRKRPNALLRAHMRGDIDDNMLAYAHEIASVAEAIERDVQVASASLEARVDVSRTNDNSIIEGLKGVRFQWAYTQWRAELQAPKRLVLDMIVGDPLPFSSAARLHRVGHRQAKTRLIKALEAWPEYVRASLHIKREDVEIAQARLNAA